MLYRCRIALALDPSRWLKMVAVVVLQPIPLDGPALEEIKPRRTKHPEHDVGQVDPPSDAQPLLVHKEEAAIEEKERELDSGEGRTGEDHGDPDMLYGRLSRIFSVGKSRKGINIP